MKILLLSAYHAHSHQYWCDGLIAHLPAHHFTLLTLPPRYFSWRVRGNALTWAAFNREILSEHYDVLLATSMVDVATLRGLVPSLAQVPCAVYFHENQFAYPMSAEQFRSVEPQMVSIYSAFAANTLVFNSQFNQRTFAQGVEQLVRRLPDGTPKDLHQTFINKSCVLPVPIRQWVSQAPLSQRFCVVWNHRWEYDKGPELLLAILRNMPVNLPLTVHVIGQQFRQIPKAFTDIRELLVHRGWLGCWGYVSESERYFELLSTAHVVLSTAVHDFQGLAVLEAVSAGCTPLVPDRLVYEEWFETGFRYPSENEAQGAATQLQQWLNQWQQGEVLPKANIDHLYWAALTPQYQALFEELSNK